MSLKEYQIVNEICSNVTTLNSKHNKLNKIFNSTEDMELKNLLRLALVFIHRIYSSVKDRKVKLYTDKSPIKELKEYCDIRISSEIPQWQILAIKNGWGKIINEQ